MPCRLEVRVRKPGFCIRLRVLWCSLVGSSPARWLPPAPCSQLAGLRFDGSNWKVFGDYLRAIWGCAGDGARSRLRDPNGPPLVGAEVPSAGLSRPITRRTLLEDGALGEDDRLPLVVGAAALSASRHRPNLRQRLLHPLLRGGGKRRAHLKGLSADADQDGLGGLAVDLLREV